MRHLKHIVSILGCTLLLVASMRLFSADMPVTYQALTSLQINSSPKKLVYADDPLNFIEHWPAAGSNKNIGLVFIHGGCWLNAYDIAHSRVFTASLAKLGYEVFSVEYRRTGDQGGGWPGTFADIKLAVTFLMHRSNTGVDDIVLLGHSAGGHLALLTAAELKSNPALKGVIGLAAITDIATYSQGQNSCQKATESFMGGDLDAKPEQYKQANPVNRDLPEKTLLLHGSADPIVPTGQAKSIGAEVTWVQGAGHFDLIHPHTPAFKQLLQVLEAFTE